MTQQATTTIQQAANGGQVATQRKPVDILKSMMNAESVQEQFKNALGKNSATFVASVIDLYNGDSNLQLCNPKQVVMEALKAATLHLPINKALGYAFIIPFKNSKKDEKGNWIKVYEPTFQMGYKGYIQLAMRTGQYRTINADVVYDGELRKVNKLTGEIAFDGERKSDKVIGYFCYFELDPKVTNHLYSCQLRICISSMPSVQNASIKALARRAFVMSGTFRSMAARRILYPLSNSPAVRFFGILTTISIFFRCSISSA